MAKGVTGKRCGERGRGETCRLLLKLTVGWTIMKVCSGFVVKGELEKIPRHTCIHHGMGSSE